MWYDILASQYLLFMTETQDSLVIFGNPCGNYLDHMLLQYLLTILKLIVSRY